MSKNNLRLVLMSCCAPCSAGAIKQLLTQLQSSKCKVQSSNNNETKNNCTLHFELCTLDDVVVLFYNPNISPESEYQKRLAEQIKLCESQGVKYIIGEYDHDKWLACVKGLEDEPEQGRRCAECFKMRIAWGADWAREHGYNALATVFGVSKWKDQKQVDDIAAQVEIYPAPVFGGGKETLGELASHRVSWVGDSLKKHPHPRVASSLCSQANSFPPPETGAGGASIMYIPIEWDESLRVDENKKYDFYHQKYCGCEFSISKK